MSNLSTNNIIEIIIFATLFSVVVLSGAADKFAPKKEKTSIEKFQDRLASFDKRNSSYDSYSRNRGKGKNKRSKKHKK
jgi:hypothetical protein